MANNKTSKKQKAFSFEGLKKFEPDSKLMGNKKVVREALIDALMHDDLDAFRDVFLSYIRYTSKSKLSQKTGLGRQTLYDLQDSSKEFNPNFKTIGAILETLAA